MTGPGSTGAEALSRGEAHDAVHGSFINLMKLPNVETLIFWYPQAEHQTPGISCFDVVLVMKGCLYDG